MNSFDETMTPRDRVDGIDSILRDLMGDELEQNPLPTPPSCRGVDDGMRTTSRTLCPDGDYASLAMVYSPYQEFDNLYDTYEEALAHGTLFRGLFLPMAGANSSCSQRGGCCK